ncbi:restriction endonuclease subunit S [Rhodobium gokarnense]|uniref:Type I restriction enzyme S subunit n=1 Tax=Rhodobium gokarnense TaxID=364296 RepID=A0ABT3H8N6_9HYPH|nr:restriction endonuclease subunit S [Rhodobium gokarnense]MCW2306713.1 type I restriction enzyme S subunit [Rhodobium gokarnense]
MTQLSFSAGRLLALYEKVAEAPDAVSRLRRFVLDLGVRGKLVEQDPADEPAVELLKRIAAEKVRLAKAGEIMKPKPLEPVEEPLFVVPMGWIWTRLGNIAAYIQRGKSPKYTAADGAPVISQKCVQWAGLDLTVAKQVTLDSLAKYEPIRFLRENDLLWNSTGTGTIGRVIRLFEPPDKLVCDSHVTVVRCLGVDPEYVRTWLRTDHVYGVIEERAAGSTNQVELTSQMANNQPVPLPPLAEQRRIVAKVEELMALLARLEAARDQREATRDRLTAASLARLTAMKARAEQEKGKAGLPAGSEPHDDAFPARFALDALPALTARPDQIGQLRQTILNLAVRGKLVKQDPTDEPASELLKRVAAEKARLLKAKMVLRQKAPSSDPDYAIATLPSGWKGIALGDLLNFVTSGSRGWSEYYADSGPFFIRAQNIRFGQLLLDNLAHVQPPSNSEGSRTQVAKGDVLIVITGAGVTNPAILEREIGEAYVSQHVGLARPTDPKISWWLLLCLMADHGGRFELVERAYGAGRPGLNLDNIRSLTIPLPPLAEQHRIVAKVDALMALCDRLEAALTIADTTRARLLEALLHEALAPVSTAEREAAE